MKKSWIERAETILRFHESKQKEFGVPGRTNHKSGWSILDTAKAFGLSHPTIIEDLRIARNADRVSHCETRAEALRYIARHGDAHVSYNGLHGVIKHTVRVNNFEYYLIKLAHPIAVNQAVIRMICAPASEVVIMSQASDQSIQK